VYEKRLGREQGKATSMCKEGMELYVSQPYVMIEPFVVLNKEQ
jgi:hypothetical protein